MTTTLQTQNTGFISSGFQEHYKNNQMSPLSLAASIHFNFAYYRKRRKNFPVTTLHNNLYYLTDNTFISGMAIHWYTIPGAYEPPKEHETCVTCQVPSQSKFIKINCQLLLHSFQIYGK